MGTAASAAYKHAKRFVNRYNAENRAHRFLDKGNLPLAPRHPTKIDERQLLEEKPYLKKEFSELNIKNKQLDEYLKKVYLTSTSEGKVPESTRPLPVKTATTLKQMFYEPEIPSTGYCTLTNVFDMLVKNYEQPEVWSASALASHYNLDRQTVVQLLTYYSLVRIEEFEFMNQEKEAKTEKDEKVKVGEFEVYTALEKKPLKQIEGKK